MTALDFVLEITFLDVVAFAFLVAAGVLFVPLVLLFLFPMLVVLKNLSMRKETLMVSLLLATFSK